MVFHKSDGSFHRQDMDGTNREVGTWKIQSDGMLCIDLPSYRKGPRCRLIKNNGDGTYSKYRKAKKVMKPDLEVWTWTKVVKGNPENY